jgi:hypothetical protein
MPHMPGVAGSSPASRGDPVGGPCDESARLLRSELGCSPVEVTPTYRVAARHDLYGLAQDEHVGRPWNAPRAPAGGEAPRWAHRWDP